MHSPISFLMLLLKKKRIRGVFAWFFFFFLPSDVWCSLMLTVNSWFLLTCFIWLDAAVAAHRMTDSYLNSGELKRLSEINQSWFISPQFSAWSWSRSIWFFLVFCGLCVNVSFWDQKCWWAVWSFFVLSRGSSKAASTLILEMPGDDLLSKFWVIVQAMKGHETLRWQNPAWMRFNKWTMVNKYFGGGYSYSPLGALCPCSICAAGSSLIFAFYEKDFFFF